MYVGASEFCMWTERKKTKKDEEDDEKEEESWKRLVYSRAQS